MKTFYLMGSTVGCLLVLAMAGCSCKTTGTGNSKTTSCSLTAECTANVEGFAIFSNGMKIVSGSDVVFQWSTDSFATVTTLGTVVNNTQGFVALPFEFDIFYPCAGGAPTIQLRAFQSPDLTEVFEAGEVNGRFDGTNSGNAAYNTIPADDAGSTTIFLDNTGSQ